MNTKRIIYWWTVLIVLLLGSIGSGCFAVQNAGAVKDGAQVLPTVWTEVSVVKVSRDAVPSNETQDIILELRAARNEWEAGQVILRSEKAAVSGLSVEVTGLRGENGDYISKDNVACYLVGYVNGIADPLIPLDSETLFAIDKACTQPIWVEVYVPRAVSSGLYTGAVRLTFNGEVVAEIPLELTVWDFELPSKPSLRTHFGIRWEYVKRHHQSWLAKEGNEEWELKEKYFEYLLQHRISPIEPTAFNDPNLEHLFADERMTSISIPYSDIDSVLQQNIARAEDKGWLDKGYVYVFDEPYTEYHYYEVRRRAERVHEINVDAKVLVPYYRSPDFDTMSSPVDHLAGYVDIWVPITDLLEQTQEREKHMPRKHMGEEVWTYVCVGPGAPYANLFLTMDSITHRLLFWQMKSAGVDGFLYWSTTYWNPTIIKDPWTDMATVKDLNPNTLGDGSLLYPGEKVKHDGPIGSIRLKMIRDGLEDYEYFVLAEAIVDSNTVSKWLELAPDFRKHLRVPIEPMFLVRDELAQAIVAP